MCSTTSLYYITLLHHFTVYLADESNILICHIYRLGRADDFIVSHNVSFTDSGSAGKVLEL